jgi:hypothetical protein
MSQDDRDIWRQGQQEQTQTKGQPFPTQHREEIVRGHAKNTKAACSKGALSPRIFLSRSIRMATRKDRMKYESLLVDSDSHTPCKPR